MYIVNIFFLTMLQRSLAANETACKLYNTRFMVAITNSEGEHFCGGSLINLDWVLTAAHCQKDYALFAGDSYTKAEYYETEIEKDIIPGVVSFWTRLIRIAKTVTHPKYYYNVKNDYEVNDIALMKLGKRWRKRRIWFVNLPTSPRSVPAPQFCPTAATLGWAREIGASFNRTKTHLKCVELTTMKYADCAVTYQESSLGEIPKSSMCTYPTNENADYCLPETDTGGPLMCGNVQYGILATAIRCGQDAPIRFTRVDHYLSFIKDALTPSPPSFRSTSDKLHHSKLWIIVFIIFNKIFI